MPATEINASGDLVLRTLNKTGYLKLPPGFTELWDYNLREDPDSLPPPTCRVDVERGEARVTYIWKTKELHRKVEVNDE